MTSTATLPSSEYVRPAQRMDLPRLAPDSYRAMLAVGRSLSLDRRLTLLIYTRVSQINGCAYCLDMHIAHLRELDETNQRLDTLAGWRESPFFTGAERAALGLAEAVTRLADVGKVPDAVYEEAARWFEPEELAQVAFAITVINCWNRLVLTAQTPPQPR